MRIAVATSASAGSLGMKRAKRPACSPHPLAMQLRAQVLRVREPKQTQVLRGFRSWPAALAAALGLVLTLAAPPSSADVPDPAPGAAAEVAQAVATEPLPEDAAALFPTAKVWSLAPRPT